MNATLDHGNASTYTQLCREQRAAYLAWQDEPIGQTAKREAYLAASNALETYIAKQKEVS